MESTTCCSQRSGIVPTHLGGSSNSGWGVLFDQREKVADKGYQFTDFS
jgi:hypothetical protein